MQAEILGMFLVIMALASYFQTITGFGLGIIVIGAASGLGLATVPALAAIVSLLALGNGAIALRGRLHHVDWPAMRAATLGMFPATVAGVLVLEYLSDSAAHVIQLLLGAAIAFSGLVFAIRPAPRATRSSNSGFAASGLLGGLFSGLFGISGPPLILQFYRQPLEMLTIRYTLLVIFVASAVGRTLFVATQGHLTMQVWTLSLLSVPAMAVGTLLARYRPPRLSQTTIRRVVFLILVALGASLIVPVVRDLEVLPLSCLECAVSAASGARQAA